MDENWNTVRSLLLNDPSEKVELLLFKTADVYMLKSSVKHDIRQSVWDMIGLNLWLCLGRERSMK